ncbi:hypothetical protein PIB30_082031 [Stylosanthes scabra]|uniref:Uncharacterized protein n=1 Tax=Stylosanthes scabra TaxID=79078 RepID=A0ABU6VVH5_9FABA|nr:hypothetical protein [Stylosanthes scabra]
MWENDADDESGLCRSCRSSIRSKRSFRAGSMWVPVYFKPKASMGLDHNELAIVAYLYGVPLMHNDEEDIVLSSAIMVQRDVFRSLLPGKPIYDEVPILVAYMMTKELTMKSGYGFLPPFFALDERTRMNPTRLSFYTTEVCMGKVGLFKKGLYPC